MQRLSTILTALALWAAVAPLRAQDANVLFPVPIIEQRMRSEPLVVDNIRGSRMLKDRTQTVVLVYPDGSTMRVKWAQAAHGGAAFNNEPRYEIAAYELQKLFLDEPDYVVPPTVLRAVPVEWIRQYDPDAMPTFDDTNSVVLAIQYWLVGVDTVGFWSEDRFEQDSVYARHFADFNILTHLIRHNDSNMGNFLMSQTPVKRVFSVDNGVAFRSQLSDRGYYWRDLRVKRLPRATVERLRALAREELDRALSVVAHFDIEEGQLVAGEPPANLRANRGVRVTDAAAQFGLTEAEINDVWRRIERLLERVDKGDIQLF